MQTIWSRAIQAKSSCRCPSCLTTPFAVARRPNTAAASRSLRYGDIATFFYSSVLATAAVADAERKDAKRQKLDTSIAEAVEALKAVELEQQKRLQILYSAQHELQVVERQRERQIQVLRETIGKTHMAQQTDSQQNTLERSEEKKLSSHNALESEQETFSGARRAFRATNVTTESPDYGDRIISSSSKPEDNSAVVPSEGSWGVKGIPNESVTEKTTKEINEGLPSKTTSLTKSASEWLSYEESSMDLTKGRQSAELWSCTPWPRFSDLKILQMNASIAKLIFRLLLMSLDGAGANGVVLNVGGTPWILSPQHRPELHMRIVKMTDRLRWLKEEVIDVNTVKPIPFPRYSNRAGHQLGEDFLHKALQTSLAETGSIHDLLPKICYELLVSKTPPSIHTFNMLIVRLCYLQHYQVASAIIDSLFECKLRPNEITTTAVLRFYDYTNDFDAFKGYVGMMNGEENHGLITLLYAPEITPENKNHFIVLSERQLPRRFRKRSILSRLAHFRREKMYIEKAPRNRDTYMALISGWLSFSDLRSALTEYVSMIRSGWNPDHVILTALLSHCALKKRMDWGAAIWREIVETHERPDSVAYYWMLYLCARVEESKMFDTVLQHGAIRHIIPTNMHELASLASMNDMERDNRLLEMLQEHIRIPGLAPLTGRKQKITQRPNDNVGSFLSGALDDADIDQLARARKYMVNLNNFTVDSFEQTNGDSKTLVIEPYRYTNPNSPPGLSIWSPGKSDIEYVSLVPKLATTRSADFAQVSHIPIEHSPEDELSQQSKPPAPRHKKAMRAAKNGAKKKAQKKGRAALGINEIKDDTEREDAIADHPSTGSQLLPSVSSVVEPGILSHVLVEHSKKNESSQLPTPSAPRRKSPCLCRRQALRAARFATEKEEQQKTSNVAQAVNEAKNREDAIADHPSMGLQLLPFLPSAAAPGVPGQAQLLLSDTGISPASVPLGLSSTATSELPESIMAISSRNADSQRHAFTTLGCAVTGELPEESNVPSTSQADKSFTAPSHSKHPRSEQMTVSLAKNEKFQLVKHVAVPSVPGHGLPKEVKITLRQNDKPQAVVPFGFIPSLKDDLGSASPRQPSQVSLRSVGHNTTHLVLNISREAQTSTSAELR
ncbi:hypothetical protein MMC17_006261 [Xylographa soralifera]|nr:hypothetical protein [Xylographa soralifera]